MPALPTPPGTSFTIDESGLHVSLTWPSIFLPLLLHTIWQYPQILDVAYTFGRVLVAVGIRGFYAATMALSWFFEGDSNVEGASPSGAKSRRRSANLDTLRSQYERHKEKKRRRRPSHSKSQVLRPYEVEEFEPRKERSKPMQAKVLEWDDGLRGGWDDGKGGMGCVRRLR